ncbi:MAG: hypothetical protein ACREPZ_02060 [Rhodanobacteraceae bacterium]
MADQKQFFKEGDTSLGTFYPTHYIVAGYHNLADAKAAAAACKKEGFGGDDVQVYDGKFVIEQMEAREGANWLKKLEQQLVEFAGTETGYVREDAEFARSGGAFLFVYAPDDEALGRARRVFAQIGPAYARRYLKIAIEVIIRNPNAP